MSDGFYDAIEPVDDFEALAQPGSYRALPDDWWVVAADVTGSTRAIEAGRYKEVNTVGVSVIAAVRNAIRPLEIPYVFGGDGAVLCIPESAVPAARTALSATVAMAERAFDLALRAGMAPVSYVRGRGHDVLVARHRISPDYVQGALFGGGADFFERTLKTNGLPDEFVVLGDASVEADYTGLECRWNEIPSPAAETVAVIVSAGGDTASAMQTYQWVMQRTREIYGDADACRPVAEDGLSMSLSDRVLSTETRLKHGRSGGAARLRGALGLRTAVAVGWILMRFGVRTKETDWGTYRRDLVANTDFRKFDGSLRLVLAGGPEQRGALVAFLDRLRASKQLEYGLHVSRSALMTCLIDKRQGAHFHFIDGAGGGYAAAAHALKNRTTTGGR